MSSGVLSVGNGSWSLPPLVATSRHMLGAGFVSPKPLPRLTAARQYQRLIQELALCRIAAASLSHLQSSSVHPKQRNRIRYWPLMVTSPPTAVRVTGWLMVMDSWMVPAMILKLVAGKGPAKALVAAVSDR